MNIFWKAEPAMGLYPYFLKHQIVGTAKVKCVSYTEEWSIQSHHATISIHDIPKENVSEESINVLESPKEREGSREGNKEQC